VITLVLGGTRSGKSEVAERLATEMAERVTYVATGRADDPDMAQRIAVHQARRPAAWTTVEAGTDLPVVLRDLGGTVLVDSLGTWITSHADLRADPAPLCAALRSRAGDTVVVSEEVGMGIHAPSEVGRQFTDMLGTVNRSVADFADVVWLVVAGRVLPMERLTNLLTTDPRP
jgi:adenosyl cobinamide kinase/adenosyl cobinamide phosphate guanylyltransferase